MFRHWLPLESNPDVLNPYLQDLGLTNPKVSFFDVFGLDTELFAMVPRPIRALLFLYPITKLTEEDDQQAAKQQEAEVTEFMKNTKIFFSNQTIPNACGTMAVLHALLNNIEHIGDIKEDSPLDLLLTGGKDTTPIERAKKIEESAALDVVHTKASVQGVTENQDVFADVDLHFICFVRVNDRCVELDGRKAFPLLHGTCSDDESFALAAAEAVKSKIQRDKDSLRYNIIALSDIPVA